MTHEDLEDTMYQLVDKAEMDLRNVIEQFNEAARNGKVKDIDGEDVAYYELSYEDLGYAIDSLKNGLDNILEK